jgi:hypothetical protein
MCLKPEGFSFSIKKSRARASQVLLHYFVDKAEIKQDMESAEQQ